MAEKLLKKTPRKVAQKKAAPSLAMGSPMDAWMPAIARAVIPPLSIYFYATP